MDLKYIDTKKGIVVVKTTTRQDLIILYLIIEPGTKIEKIGYWIEKDAEKSKKKKIKLLLRIVAEKKEFYDNYLKITGKIEFASKDIGTGHYVSLKIEVGDEITIYKKLKKYEIKLLQSSKKKTYKYLLVAFDLEEASIAILENTRSKIVRRIENRNLEDKNEYYGLLASEIVKLSEEYNIKHILIASPLDWASELKRFIEDKYEFEGKIKDFKISYGGDNGIREMLRRREILKYIEESEYAKIKMELENLKKELIAGKLIPIRNIEDLELPVRKVIVLETCIHNPDKLKILENLVEKGIEFMIVPENIEESKLLKDLGGVVGILYYKVF